MQQHTFQGNAKGTWVCHNKHSKHCTQRQQQRQRLYTGYTGRPRVSTLKYAGTDPSPGGCHALLKAEPLKHCLLPFTFLLLLLGVAHKSVKALSTVLSQGKQCCCQNLLFRDRTGSSNKPNCCTFCQGCVYEICYACKRMQSTKLGCLLPWRTGM